MHAFDTSRRAILRRLTIVLCAALTLVFFAMTAVADRSGSPGHHHDKDNASEQHKHDQTSTTHGHAGDGQHMQHGHHHRHDFWETPPAEYANARSTRWDDPAAVARGQQLFMTYCMVCHGTDGKGTGPAAKGLEHPPADLTHHFHRAPGDGDAYLFWRISEGGQVEPFKSMQSTMPPFKTVLTAEQRWDVLAYVHAQFHGGFLPATVSGEGTVIALVPSSEQIVVQHGVIQGFMDAMTMGYKVNAPSLLNGLNAGDRIRFTIDTQHKAITRIDRLQQ